MYFKLRFSFNFFVLVTMFVVVGSVVFDNKYARNYERRQFRRPDLKYPIHRTGSMGYLITAENPWVLRDPVKLINRLGDGSRVDCRKMEGLPTPESGCCGVQLTYLEFQSIITKSRSRRVGRSDSEDLTRTIKGGMPVKLYQFPWMVRLVINPLFPGAGRTSYCGGNIISSRYILTAAHCLNGTYYDLKQLQVILGEYDIRSNPLDCIAGLCIRNKAVGVKQAIVHPMYDTRKLYNDIALIETSSRIPYTAFIRPICLPTVDVKNSIDAMTISGWSLTGNEHRDLKRSAIVQHIPNDICKEHYSYIDDSVICAIGINGEDVCEGDSGGPLMGELEGRYFLTGVVSGKRGDQECGSYIPSLYSYVYYHHNWIASHVNISS